MEHWFALVRRRLYSDRLVWLCRDTNGWVIIYDAPVTPEGKCDSVSSGRDARVISQLWQCEVCSTGLGAWDSDVLQAPLAALALL